MSVSNTKRIAKNTIMLYFRQILIMIVSLYTVRVVLNVLGAEDYGIYNVVAGVVVLFSFVNNAMTQATQRYLNYSMGENDEGKIKRIFKTSFMLHLFISISVLILAETVGVWFVSYKLNIPDVRKTAAFWCYQFAVFTTFINIIRIPFHATIIAYEQMEFFATISIVEVILKLVVVFLLKIIVFDKLIIYSLLIFCISFVITLGYFCYTKLKYKIVNFSTKTDFKLMKELMSFSGWTLLTGCADMSKSQGTSMIFNIFHGVAVNAAIGIANQINAAIYQFVANFQTAYTPQVVKFYAAGEKESFCRLVKQSMKISFVLFSIIVIPFSINAEFVISVWLKNNVPEYTIAFAYLILLDSLIGTFIGPLASAMQGIGKIKVYQIVISVFIFLNLPFTYIMSRYGISPEYVLLTRTVLSFIALVWRLFYLKSYLSLRPLLFLFRTIIIGLFLDSIALVVGSFIKMILVDKNMILAFFVSCIVSGLFVTLLSFAFLLEKDERKAIVLFIKSKLKRV